jgi:hypothetical protein
MRALDHIPCDYRANKLAVGNYSVHTFKLNLIGMSSLDMWEVVRRQVVS